MTTHASFVADARRSPHRTARAAVGIAAALVLGACSGADGDVVINSPAPAPSTTASTATSAAAGPVPRLRATGTVAAGLEVPWGVAFLPDGSALVGQRPTGEVVRVSAGGGTEPAGTEPAGTVPGVADQGEGGLLGLAVLPPRVGSGGGTEAPDPGQDAPVTVFAYFTSTAGDNRVVRMRYAGGRLGRARVILDGIASAGNHNGGALVLGPDRKLWIGTGDAGDGTASQRRESLNGKILRIEPDGSVPGDNPFGDSPVWSYGHRNVQGIAFDSRGEPWATEFGQNSWDELNLVRKGRNYGWPEVEGRAGQDAFVDPVVQWRTSAASPSGMAIVRDVAYVGALRGERVWQVPLDGDTASEPRDYFRGDYGRIRNVAATPGGGLWMTTSNRDGRGDPAGKDDRVVALSFSTG